MLLSACSCYGEYPTRLQVDLELLHNIIQMIIPFRWGWLGFNCGSIFGVSGDKWKYAARSAIATLNSSVGGGVLAMAYSFLLYRKVRVLILINGILASLVAITGVSTVGCFFRIHY